MAIPGYPEILHEHLAIPTEYMILCGMAIGYPDPTFPANNLHIGRDPIEKNATFVDA